MVPLVETPLGPIRGSLLKTWTGKDILAFRAIRYAKPPTGQLRFKAPVPVEPWSEVVDATEDGPVCHQPGAEYFGPPSEDCLYINVYTKELSGSKPVIIFFHPGGWFSMTSRSDWAGPDYLLDQDLVLVTVNYRLGPLGFMSTGDEHAVGNYGMKDQVLAMKWVKYNIAAFGGDPKSVTITGYSAGSTSVMLHMLSPMSKGLFHRGISMSAGITSNWVIMKNPLELSRKLGDVVGCPTDTTTKQLVQCLRTIPAETLADSYQKMKVISNIL
ncbi:hypothetical protein AAG570_010503 [Ranatra chinensis]|uniref:Carboxylic ester hydrolase n=1 Tax=Ranatra chinensis TaxID=642074 RepID=A0ABD0YMS1_9HEMI